MKYGSPLTFSTQKLLCPTLAKLSPSTCTSLDSVKAFVNFVLSGLKFTIVNPICFGMSMLSIFKSRNLRNLETSTSQSNDSLQISSNVPTELLLSLNLQDLQSLIKSSVELYIKFEKVLYRSKPLDSTWHPKVNAVRQRLVDLAVEKFWWLTGFNWKMANRC